LNGNNDFDSKDTQNGSIPQRKKLIQKQNLISIHPKKNVIMSIRFLLESLSKNGGTPRKSRKNLLITNINQDKAN
jgi:hypothetical protein